MTKLEEQREAIRTLSKSENGQLFLSYLRDKACYDMPDLILDKNLSYDRIVALGWMRAGVKKLVTELEHIINSEPTKVRK